MPTDVHRPACQANGSRRPAVILFLLLWLCLAGCPGSREIKLAGRTMGTTYHVTVVGGYLTSARSLQQAIDDRLEAIEASMSTYRSESEISRFNRLRGVDTPFPVSEDFQQVMKVSQELFRITGGAWDGTLEPLIDLWGFGRSHRVPEHTPDPEMIRGLLAGVGFDQVVLHPEGGLSKRLPFVTLDLASVAKGYAVDAVAELIGREGFKDYLVEIGGEVYAAGVRIDGQPWRIGINKPEADAAFDQVYHVVTLQNRAFATSGDYRNYVDIEGRRYAHIIDPRTGYPVANGVVSVSVTAETCALADGLATALVVMGVAAGIDLVETLDAVECLIVTRDDQGRLHDHASRGFQIVN